MPDTQSPAEADPSSNSSSVSRVPIGSAKITNESVKFQSIATLTSESNLKDSKQNPLKILIDNNLLRIFVIGFCEKYDAGMRIFYLENGQLIGTPIKEIKTQQGEHWSKLCDHYRNNLDGDQKCEEEDKTRIIDLINEKNERAIVQYQCFPLGLIDVMAKIKVNGKIAGALISGQCLIEKSENEMLDYLCKKCRESNRKLIVKESDFRPALKLEMGKIQSKICSEKRLQELTEKLETYAMVLGKICENAPEKRTMGIFDIVKIFEDDGIFYENKNNIDKEELYEVLSLGINKTWSDRDQATNTTEEMKAFLAEKAHDLKTSHLSTKSTASLLNTKSNAAFQIEHEKRCEWNRKLLNWLRELGIVESDLDTIRREMEMYEKKTDEIDQTFRELQKALEDNIELGTLQIYNLIIEAEEEVLHINRTRELTMSNVLNALGDVCAALNNEAREKLGRKLGKTVDPTFNPFKIKFQNQRIIPNGPVFNLTIDELRNTDLLYKKILSTKNPNLFPEDLDEFVLYEENSEKEQNILPFDMLMRRCYVNNHKTDYVYFKKNHSPTESTERYEEKIKFNYNPFILAKDYLPLPKFESYRLKVIFLNLLENAVKYSFRRDEGRIVLITCFFVDENFCVEISTRGWKIDDDEIMGKIYERGYRGRNVKRERLGGTGLGLSNVKKIINKYGWSIDARCQAMKNEDGTPTVYQTVFKLTIPLNKKQI